MPEKRQIAERHDRDWFLARRSSSPKLIGEQPKPKEIAAPRIARHAFGLRPLVGSLPDIPLRLSRQEIMIALGTHPDSAQSAQAVEQIIAETKMMDSHPEGSPEFKAHHDHTMRLLRQIGLYPI